MTTFPRTVLPRLRPWILGLACCIAFVAAVPAARAGDDKTGRIDIEATLEPADLAPGGSGTLVVKGTLLNAMHHIYAAGDQAMTYKPIEAAGVTYDMDSKSISPSEDYTEEYTGEVHQVWHGSFTLRVPVTIAADAAPDATLGISFTYYGCIAKRGCYPPIADHAATVVLAGKAAPVVKPAADAGSNGGPPVNPRPDVAADTPTVPPAITEEEGGAQVKLDEANGRIVVTFAPALGWHFYGPGSADGSPIAVTPKATEGVTFGEVEMPEADHIESPVDAVVPFTREAGAKVVELEVEWAGCEGDNVTGRCNPPRKQTFRIAWPGAEAAAPTEAAAPAEPPKAGEVLFPVVDDDEIGGADDERSWLRGLWTESRFLFFGALFVLGMGLAFTPCVLPIIPITISVISGGNADIPRNRLAALLGLYVFGLCMTFATMGVVAAQTGGAMSALFAMPGVQWGFVVLFLVLGFGMYGVYELQPPAWLMNLQGGARKRQGSALGAFLFGCLGAIIASPCTGPAIAVLLLMAAKEGSTVVGFSMFFVLGLGMGAVLFAAGSLNFLMRPGPWMTWVRYGFGVLIVGVAMYYLRNYQLVEESTMWIIGALVCALAAAGIAWHLHKKEGEDLKPAALRALKVGALTAIAIGFVAWYTRVPDDLLSWTKAKSPEHLQELVAESSAQGKPVVVDFWGTWCTNCKVYDKRIASTPSLRTRFERITRVKVDLSGDDKVRWPMRHALGIEESGAPVMVFIDRKGRIRRKADLVGLQDDDVVASKIDLVLREQATKTSAR